MPHSENGITNAIEINDTLAHGICVMASNNDAMLRIFAADTFKPLLSVGYEWAVNYATMRPHSSMAAVVGDHPDTFLTDTNNGASRALCRAQFGGIHLLCVQALTFPPHPLQVCLWDDVTSNTQPKVMLDIHK